MTEKVKALYYVLMTQTS